MVGKVQLDGTPMYEALKDLAGKMDKARMPPIELNVIGGFALMLHGVRPADGVTDIDYVGACLPADVNRFIEETGRAHHMEPGWINNDGMARGIGMEDFELSTGPLHFSESFAIGNITINILDEKDLLRLKIIAVDTAMTELEATGGFARVKDFHDIHNLMGRLGMSAEGAIREYAGYMICYPDTGDLIRAIADKGPDGGLSVIEDKKQAFKGLAGGSHGPDALFGENSLGSLLGSLDAVIDSMGRAVEGTKESRTGKG